MVLKISAVTSTQEFLALKNEWNLLLRECNHTFFSTWDWLSIWWKHFGKNKKLLILKAEENGKIVALAPLSYSVYNLYGLKTKKITFMGSPNADYNNFILPSDRSDECLTKFFEYLCDSTEDKWDTIELEDVYDPSVIHFIQNIEGELQTFSSRVLHECLYIKLPSSYDLLYSQLAYKFRQNLRRSMNNLEKNNKINFKDYSSNDKVNDGMQVLFELHQKRWKEAGETGAFADPKIRDFNLDVAQHFNQKNMLRLVSLNVDEVPSACSYGFVYEGKFYYYLHGVDPAYSRYSVGNLIIVNLLKKCMAEGLTEFDFLRGDEGYKFRWTQSSRKNYNFVIGKRQLFSKTQNLLLRNYYYQTKKLLSHLRIPN